MTLVALTNVLRESVMVRRFHRDPHVRATEMLLQERMPRDVSITKPRPVEGGATTPWRPLPRVRRYRTPHTPWPEAHFLSNGNFWTVVTNAGGGGSSCRGRMVTRIREDRTRDLGGQFIYLRDVRSGAVWSATYQPIGREPEDYEVLFHPDKAVFRRVDDDIETRLEIAVSPQDDVEVRRLSLTNRSDRPREIEVTSYAELALAPMNEDLAHPAFGKLFLETRGFRTARRSCARGAREQPGSRGRSRSTSSAWSRRRTGRSNGRPTARGSSAAAAISRIPSRSTAAPLSGTTGAVLDPIASIRVRVRLAPGRVRAPRVRDGDRRRPPRGDDARRDLSRSRGGRADARARVHEHADGAPPPRHHGRGRRSSSTDSRRASFTSIRRCARSRRSWPQQARPAGLLGARNLGRPAHPARQCRRGGRRAARRPGAQGPGVLAAQGPARRRRGPERAPRTTATRCSSSSKRCVATGLWAAWRGKPGGVFLLRSDGMGEDEVVLLKSGARAVLSGLRGDLAAQFKSARPEPRSGDPFVPTAAASRPCRRLPNTAPALRIANGLGGFCTDGDYVVVLNEDHETPMPWANVIANPGFGTIVTAGGRCLDLVREQPREPADPVRQRSRDRSDRRGDLPPGRRERRDLVRDAGAAPPEPPERPLGDQARPWPHDVRARAGRASRRSSRSSSIGTIP